MGCRSFGCRSFGQRWNKIKQYPDLDARRYALVEMAKFLATTYGDRHLIVPYKDNRWEDSMDLLTHIFLPLIAIYSLRRFNKIYFVISLFAILPDFDVFLGIHRGLLHSLVFLIPLALLILTLERLLRSEVRYAYIAIFFLFSHIFLDFFAGGVPFLYPIVETGIGVEFPMKVSFGSSVVIEDFMPKLVFVTPESVHGKVFSVLSGFGVVTATVFAFIWLADLKLRER